MAWGNRFLTNEHWTEPLWKRGLFKAKKPVQLSLAEGETGFVVQATTLEGLFTNAATNLFNDVTERVRSKNVKLLVPKTIEVTAASSAELLADWLNVLLSLLHRQGMVCREYEFLDIGAQHLEAEVSGEEYTAQSHRLKLLIKRVVANRIEVQRANGFWQALVVYETDAELGAAVAS